MPEPMFNTIDDVRVEFLRKPTPLELAVTKFMLGTWDGPVVHLPSDTAMVTYVHVDGMQLAIPLRRLVSATYNGVHIEYKAGLHDWFGLFITDGQRVIDHA